MNNGHAPKVRLAFHEPIYAFAAANGWQFGTRENILQMIERDAQKAAMVDLNQSKHMRDFADALRTWMDRAEPGWEFGGFIRMATFPQLQTIEKGEPDEPVGPRLAV